MKLFRSAAIAIASIGVLSGTAMADVVIMQQADSAPTYDITLDFDEPGGPAGINVPNNSWSGPPWNIPDFSSGDIAANFVGDNSGATGQGTNSYFGPFGVFIDFGQDLTEMSFQGWDNGGPSTPFGGGAAVVAFNDGVDIGILGVTPAWGGVGDSWFDITTTGDTVFDRVAFLGFAMVSPQSVVDNLSWNVVPEPAALSLLAMGSLALLRRRR